MHCYIILGICSWLTSYVVAAGIVPHLVDPSLEKSDEARDVEIFKAVYNSIREWERKKKFKEKYGRAKREDSTVCYADIGCFEASGPFSYLEMLPSTPEEISTKFILYPSHRKRRSGLIPAEVPFKNMTEAYDWADKGFNSSLPTKVMIHGFGSDCTHVWVYEMRSALMAVEEMNLICVDWGNGATLPNYVKAAANTRLVGKQLSMLLKGLIAKNGLSAKKLHLIGFSLGAHVAGFAGAELGNLSRITGLDPAGPLFESQDPRARLDQTDAEFVDVIHSNGENLILGGLGSWQAMGHVDFYPNGGRMQKGCSNLFVGAFTDIIWSSPVEGRSLCNHRRAYKFFTDSVSPRCQFPAFPCNTYEDFIEGNCFPCNDKTKCGNMGYYADRSKGRGQLYLITREEEPFCAHQYLIKIESSPSDIPITSYGKLQVTLIGDSLLNETFTMTRKDDEEMKLGSTISRIVVPHPILLDPAQIQIHYIAYSGWLSSGLSQWKIDKVTLSDSFGKSHSVCKKNLILESGVPVTLPLYPGECNLPKEQDSPHHEYDAQDRNHDYKDKAKNKDGTSKFVPTPVVKIGVEVVKEGEKSEKEENKNTFNLKDAIEIFNLPWGGDKDNRLDEEVESSRAFNTRIVVVPSKNNSSENTSEIIREVMEPILKPQSSKHGRSHNPDSNKPEISEPILRPNAKNSNLRKPSQKTETKNYFYDLDKDDKWIPTKSSTPRQEKWKRQDDSKVIPVTENAVRNNDGENDNGFNAIVKTVQFLPQRLARMFEEAEKYARETILPLVSTYTPKFISDIITPSEKKYLPLTFEETTENQRVTTLNGIEGTERLIAKSSSTEESEEAIRKRVSENLHKLARVHENSETTTALGFTNDATPFTNIQKIPPNQKRVERVASGYADSSTSSTSRISQGDEESGRSVKDSITPSLLVEKSTTVAPSLRITAVTKAETLPSSDANHAVEAYRKEIYIDLPVFEEAISSIKYIPLNLEGEDKKN